MDSLVPLMIYDSSELGSLILFHIIPKECTSNLLFKHIVTCFSFAGFTPGLFFPKKTYKEPVPIGEGAFVDVMVTHVAAPDEIYVQKVVNIMVLIK